MELRMQSLNLKKMDSMQSLTFQKVLHMNFNPGDVAYMSLHRYYLKNSHQQDNRCFDWFK
jgi:hypothetical protein